MKDILEFIFKGTALILVSSLVLIIAIGFFFTACLGIFVL